MVVEVDVVEVMVVDFLRSAGLLKNVFKICSPSSDLLAPKLEKYTLPGVLKDWNAGLGLWAFLLNLGTQFKCSNSNAYPQTPSPTNN